MTQIFDTNVPVTRKVVQLKQLGIVSVIRYINPLSLGSEKTVTPAEARAMTAAGIRLGLVCEGWGGASNAGIGATINEGTGERDARVCRQYAPNIGAPQNACIYFAVDVDASAADIQHYIIPYFRSVRRVLFDGARPEPIYRVGIYACGMACDVVKQAGLADLTWLSNAMGWNGSRAYKAGLEWSLLQHLPQNILGLDTDPDDANPAKPDWGDFVAFGGAPGPTPELTGIPHIQDMCNKILELNPPLELDGKLGPMSLGAIKTILEQKLKEV